MTKLSIIDYAFSILNYQLSTINYQLSKVSPVPFAFHRSVFEIYQARIGANNCFQRNRVSFTERKSNARLGAYTCYGIV
jgi:hypothetical protein